MDTAAIVVRCALSLLGLSPDTFPPIAVLNSRPSMVSPDADAFTASPGDGARVIYLIGPAPAFAAAMKGVQDRGECGDREPLQMVAGILAHEEWHVKHGSDERGAYLAQLRTLLLVGSGPSRWPYRVAQRSMRTVLAREKTQGHPTEYAIGDRGPTWVYADPWLGRSPFNESMDVDIGRGHHARTADHRCDQANDLARFQYGELTGDE